MATYSITIDGVAKKIQPGWTIQETANGIDTLDCEVLSTDGIYRPPIGARVILTENATRIFGGTIDAPAEAGLGGIGGTAIVTRLSVVDFNELAHRRVTGITIPPGSVKHALTALVPYIPGVTLDPTQDDGDTLPELIFAFTKISDALDQIAAMTFRVWEVTYNETLRMFNPLGNLAPFDVTASNRMALGDIAVEPSSADYANRVLVLGGTGEKEITEHFTGNGVQRAFVLTYSLSKHPGFVTMNGVDEPIYAVLRVGDVLVFPVVPGAWYFSTVGGVTTITRADPPPSTAAITFVYTAQFPVLAFADDFDEQSDPRHGIIEKVYRYEDIFEKDVLQALADSHVVRDVIEPRTVRYRTDQNSGIRPGMTQTITVPQRNLSGTFTVTDVATHSVDAKRVEREVTAIEGAIYTGSSWRDELGSWGSSSTTPATGAVSVVSGGGSVGSGTLGSIAKWGPSNSLTNSLLTESDTTVTMAGTLVAQNHAGPATGLTDIPASQLTGVIAFPVQDTIIRLGTIISGSVPWFIVNKTGSSLADLTTKSAGDLTSGNLAYARMPAGFGTWTATPTISGDITAQSAVSVAGALTAPENLLVRPPGDLIVDPGGKDILPVNNYDINLGMLPKKFLAIHAAELWVETLVAQNTIATIGGRVLVAPTNVLVVDVLPSHTQITTKYNNLSTGDILYMESDGKVEFMLVTGGGSFGFHSWLLDGSLSLLFSSRTTSGNGYIYNVTRNLDGSGANDWFAGDAMLNTGQVGNGFIDLYSVRGIRSSAEIGPTIVGNVRVSTTYNGWEPRWAIGNLNGLYGYGVDTYGVGLGIYGTNGKANTTLDATNGLRFRDNATVYAQLNAGIFRIGLSGSNRMEWDGTNLTLVSSTVSMNAGGMTIETPPTTYSTTYAYKFTPNGTLTGSEWGLFAKNADAVNRYVGIRNIVTSNVKTSWVELTAQAPTAVGAPILASISLFANGVSGAGSITISSDNVAISGSISILGTMTVTSAGGLLVNNQTVVGATGSGDPLLIQIAGVNKQRFDANGDLRPETDGTMHVGVPTKRYGFMTALSFNTTDVSLDNGWSLTESYRIGIEEPGVGLVDDAGLLVAFFGQTKTYLKMVADVDDLPFAQTALADRVRMDPTPWVRVIGTAADGSPIHRTEAEVPMPRKEDTKTNKARKAKASNPKARKAK